MAIKYFWSKKFVAFNTEIKLSEYTLLVFNDLKRHIVGVGALQINNFLVLMA